MLGHSAKYNNLTLNVLSWIISAKDGVLKSLRKKLIYYKLDNILKWGMKNCICCLNCLIWAFACWANQCCLFFCAIPPPSVQIWYYIFLKIQGHGGQVLFLNFTIRYFEVLNCWLGILWNKNDVWTQTKTETDLSTIGSNLIIKFLKQSCNDDIVMQGIFLRKTCISQLFVTVN